MTELRDTNRAMFWRILRRLLGANRGRLFVMLLALGAGAAVTAALLNLQVDAKRRLTTEFRAFGANVLITPRDDQYFANAQSPRKTLQNALSENLSVGDNSRITFVDQFLYLVGSIVPEGSTSNMTEQGVRAVISGFQGDPLGGVVPFRVEGEAPSIQLRSDETPCLIGLTLAKRLQVQPLSRLLIHNENRETVCRVRTVADFGGPEDNQLFVPLGEARFLDGGPTRVSLIAARISGTPQQVNRFITDLQARLPSADVRPIRQFTEGEAKIYNRISGLLTATVGIVLLLTALCVMAAMTNVAIERKMDVGLMKAIGGATRRVVRLFLAEAALLGLVGGLIGAALGILLSIGLGKAVFGVAARPRLIVYPVAVGLTMLVAILSAFPLRRLASIRPASVFRGEA